MRGRTWAVLMLCAAFPAASAPATSAGQSPADVALTEGRPTAPSVRLKKVANPPGAPAALVPDSTLTAGDERAVGVGNTPRKKAPAVPNADPVPAESPPLVPKRSKKTVTGDTAPIAPPAPNTPAVKTAPPPPVSVDPAPRVPRAPQTPAPQPGAPSSAAPQGATAQCKDGSYSMSQQHRGACSRHGGVASWLQN